MKILFPLILLLLLGCAAKVVHPTKTAAEMQTDIDFCTTQANRDYWMDPVAAMYHAYDCLEARGYQRDSTHISSQVEKALGEAPKKKPQGSAKPCAVPCGKKPG